ncbi:putative permease of the major facilitator superfamily [Klebsiella variicola]|uniref:Putative permease of the major facilitator superfamily n=1 Tax=Klebsiella variicola TaxID=244366 RepID=A0A7H4MHB1_KLEVA|nr:putative permease of the major facilitator superfamily [Klebsiella variicola]
MTPTSLSTRDAGWIIFILALGAGFSVASIYYAQPLLPLMGANLHLSVEGMGLVPTLTQAGYALGILFLLPLGDRHDRRRLILLKSAMLAILLFLCSLTGQLTSLLVVSLLIGMAATMAQDIVPAAAILSPAGKQGKMVGTVMTGLLLGILLSRTVSGVVGAVFGWRVMYQAAAVSVALIGLVMWRVLPRFAIHSTLSYPQLMASMAHLWLRYPALRRAALAQGALSVAFSAFWSTLAVMLSEHYHMGSAVAGGFGIAGAAGALAAPLAGGLADKFGAGKVTQMGRGAGHPLLRPDVYAAAAPSAWPAGADCSLGYWLRSRPAVKPGGTSEPGLQPGAAGPWPPERSAVHRGLYRDVAGVGAGQQAVRAGRLERSGHPRRRQRGNCPGDPPAGECAPHRSRTPHIIKKTRFA